MDERRTGNDAMHLDVEQLGLAADGQEPLGETEGEHLALCAVCRAEVERQRRVGSMVAELGQAYREAAPPEWPALSAIETLAKEGERGGGWLDRLSARLGVRARVLGTALAAGLAVLVAAAVVLVALRPPAERATGGGVASAGSDAARVAVGPTVPGDAATTAAEAGSVGPTAVAPAVPPAMHNSSIVAMAAGRDVSYVMMNVPYEGGTAAVLWLSALPAGVTGPANVPL